MAENKKMGFLQSKGYSQVSNGTATATPLAPGERVAFNEDDPQHKLERERAEAGDRNALFDYVEIDLEQEAAQQSEQAEMLVKAEEIAAEARNAEAKEAAEALERQEELRDQAAEEGQPAVNAGTDFPPQDEEAVRLSEQAGAGQRATTQADVVKPAAKKRAAKPAES